MVYDRDFIFHMCILCGSAFLRYQGQGHPSATGANVKCQGHIFKEKKREKETLKHW